MSDEWESTFEVHIWHGRHRNEARRTSFSIVSASFPNSVALLQQHGIAEGDVVDMTIMRVD